MEGLDKTKIWKYAKREWERVFLLNERPKLESAFAIKEISDAYITQSHIRLRKTFDGQTSQFKLTKKLDVQEGQQSVKWISTIYLSQDEYAIFQELKAANLEKKRYYFKGPMGEDIGIDEVKIGPASYYLAEVEFNEEEDMRAYQFPWEYKQEVTGLPFYSGYQFALRSAGLSS